VAGRPNFLFPVKVLSRLFRGKFLADMRKAYDSDKLSLAGSTAGLQARGSWQELLSRLYDVDWVVYAKPPFGGPDHVFRYLGRYTHRVAISNHRLIALKDGRVQFWIRDYAHGNRRRKLVLEASEFIRRFLLHVLPKRFVRIRHFGLWAGRNVMTRLARARELLELDPIDAPSAINEPAERQPWWVRCLELFDFDPLRCPQCGVGRLHRAPLAMDCATQARAPPLSCR
jgi:hypothetical protein